MELASVLLLGLVKEMCILILFACVSNLLLWFYLLSISFGLGFYLYMPL